MSRPRKYWSVEEFEKLCGLQCTKEEIAAWFDFSEDTLENRLREEYNECFSVVFAKKRGIGRTSLRRKQWKIADNNAAMAIFLGKNYLGQRDVQEIETNKPIQLNYNLDKKPEPKDGK